MPTVRGDDSDLGNGIHFGCGVYGTGSPWQWDSGQGGPLQTVNSIGVLGLEGSPEGILTFESDRLGSNMLLDFSAAVVGYRVGDSTTSDYDSFGFLGGRDLQYGQLAGVYGASPDQGVFGFSQSGTGVYGTGNYGVRGETKDGIAAVLGKSYGTAKAAIFSGDVEVTGNMAVTGQVLHKGDLQVNGNVAVTGDIALLNRGDLAERFPLASNSNECAGMVMVLGQDGKVSPCSREYDSSALGIVSGAGPLKPAITLHPGRNAAEASVDIALVGTVYCWVDADPSAVNPGDLLTTSAVEGHAMKATDATRLAGAIIGKALTGLSSGRSLIPVVVMLR